MTQTVVVGIDTSAYTCSVAVMNLRGELLRDIRVPLRVRPGTLGLRQAEALHQHVRCLPSVVEEAFVDLEPRQATLSGVAVSYAPRPQKDSFMPVFLAGHGVGRAIAATRGIPCWEASHQEGHIWAALWALPALKATRILAVHLSGGTTEAVVVQGVGQEHQSCLDLHIAAATSDISAGQFVDRVGNALGLPFPAGPSLERLAQEGQAGRVRLPVGVRRERLSFSGPESAAQRAIASGEPPADVARGVLDCLAESLQLWLKTVVAVTHTPDVVLAGGVVANRLLRQSLETSPLLSDCQLWFAPPRLSGDNAVGLAAWAAARVGCLPIACLPGPRMQASDVLY